MATGAVYVVGHRNPDADSICSAIAYAQLKRSLGETNVKAARAGAIDAETAYVLQRFDVAAPELLTDATGLDLILVDHNEVGQALAHIERANIHEVWEHHRIGDLRLPEPIVFHCEPVGATATLIAELYFAHHVTPTRAMAGILLASIVSDTVVFRSPTTTEKDRSVAAALSPLAGVRPEVLGGEMLRIKAEQNERKSDAELVRDDLKIFDLDGLRVGVAQVEVAHAGAFDGRRAAIFSEMRALRESASLAQVILMITDVRTQASELWFVGERVDLFERAFGRLDDGVVHVPGCMSRKKQIIPRLEAAIEVAQEQR